MHPEIDHEIRSRKHQLAEFLAARYIDQSLVLGFSTIVQGRFQEWILEDLAAFGMHGGPADGQAASFASIDLLQSLWVSFHYPIIKMYQRSHAELLALSVDSLKDVSRPKEEKQRGVKQREEKQREEKEPNQKEPKQKLYSKSWNSKKKSGKAKEFRAVEMRKLNESFSKFIKSAKAFYNLMLREFAKLPNRLITSDFLKEFDISVSHDSALPADFHSSLSYAIFYCLLGLGNLARSEVACSVNYAEPGKSVAAYYKHQRRSPDEKTSTEQYLFPMFCYYKCIGLLPTMHEPYNHLGVICNSAGQNFKAVFWFVRAQSTRDSNTAIPKHNLAALMRKPWLQEAYMTAIKSPRPSADAKNAMLLRIVGHYFYPTAFSVPLYVHKAQTDFLALVTCGASLAETSRLVIEQLTVLFSFSSFADFDVSPGFHDFVLQYASVYLGAVPSFAAQADNVEGVLQVIRFILAFYRKRGSLPRDAKARQNLSAALNSLLDFDSEETKTKILEAFGDNMPPVRTHYFDEDVHYKDYTPIGCQFKDFNDDHLFKSGNISLLFGGSFYSQNKKIPEYLDNKAVCRISKDAELAPDDPDARQKAIAAECTRHDNILRMWAIVVMVKKIFGPAISLNAEGVAFEVEKVDIVDSQDGPEKRQRKSKKGKKAPPRNRAADSTQEDSNTENMEGLVSSQPVKLAPSSLEEIQSMILGHAPKLSAKEDPVHDGGLVDMVHAIVSDQEISSSADKQVPATHDALEATLVGSGGDSGHADSEAGQAFEGKAPNMTSAPSMQDQPEMQMPSSQNTQYPSASQAYPGEQQMHGFGPTGYMGPVPGMYQGPGMAAYPMGYPIQGMGGPPPYGMMPGYYQGMPMVQGQYMEQQKQWAPGPNGMYMQYKQ